jgi:phospholipid/cholesterol/gamma-HCH transport system substrate-binding protein
MENRAHFVFIGAAVVAFMVGLVAFIVWKLNSGTQEDLAYYRIYFDGDVQGLTPDSSVYYRGIKVGRVTDVRIGSRQILQADGSRRPIERVVVTLALNYDQQIRENSYALFEKPLIAGQSFIQIVGGPDGYDPKPRKRKGEEPYPEISTGTTFFQAAASSAQDVLAKASQSIDRINAVLSDENIAAVNKTLNNVSAFTNTLSSRNKEIEQVVADLPETVAQMKATMASLENLGKSANLLLAELGPQDEAARKLLASTSPSELRQTLGSVRQAVNNINAAADSVNKLLGDNRAPLRQFTEQSLGEFSQMIRELRALAANLNVIVTRIERDPTGFIFGGKQGYQPGDRPQR